MHTLHHVQDCTVCLHYSEHSHWGASACAVTCNTASPSLATSVLCWYLVHLQVQWEACSGDRTRLWGASEQEQFIEANYLLCNLDPLLLVKEPLLSLVSAGPGFGLCFTTPCGCTLKHNHAYYSCVQAQQPSLRLQYHIRRPTPYQKTAH